MSIFKGGGGIVPVGPNAPEPSANNGQIYGVDIYHEDNVTSFAAMKASGIEFVYIKASQGQSADQKFAQYYAQAKAAGLIVGGYHFYNTASSQMAQAQFFWGLCKEVGYSKDDLPPCFDFENSSGNYNMTDASNCESFLSALQSASGRLPMLYMSDSVPGELGSPSWMKVYPWWIARYGAAPKSPYVIWQESESATIPGLGNPGDKNLFNGSVADLQAWISNT